MDSRLRVLLDVGTRIRAIDSDLADALGYENAELRGEPFGRILTADSIAGVGDELVAIVSGRQESDDIGCRLRRRDGTTTAAIAHLAARNDNDGKLQGFAAQITIEPPSPEPSGGGARRPALADHLRSLALAAAVIDANGAIVDQNPAWVALFGVGDDPAATPLDALAIEPDQALLRRHLFEPGPEEHRPSRFDVRCHTPDGIVWARFSLVPMGRDRTYRTVTAEDVSAELLMYRVLSANEALFRSLTEGSPVAVARLAPDLTIAYANPAFLRLTGTDPTGGHGNLLDLIVEDDRTRAGNMIERRLGDGDAAPVRCRLIAVADATVSLRFAAVHDDELGAIGAIVAAEVVPEASTGPAATSAVVGARGDLVGIANLRSGEILYLNEAARVLLGPPADLSLVKLYGDLSQRYADEIYPVLRRGDSWTGELDMIDVNGTTIRVHQTITADLDDDGEPEQASAVGTQSADALLDHDTLAHLATHDTLTGLPNRSLLLDHMQLALARSARDGRPIGVLFIDLDKFKAVNDTHGHEAGDALLKEVASRLSTVLRPSDTVARLGGDEFVVLCEDIHGEADAMTIAARIRASLVDDELLVRGAPSGVTPSIGVAMSGAGVEDPETMLRQADAAMYRAKQSGRDRVELFDDVLRERNQRREEMRRDLEALIDERALEVHYQPIVDLATGKVCAVEAFARWPHPERGMLSASDFLDVAITSGLDQRLDRLVLARAFADASRWCQERGAAAPRVHVNVTGRSILSGALASEVERFLALTRIPPSKLCIEVSERFLMDDGDATAARLGRLHDLGVRLAIDGVGTGATSLQQLRRYHLDMLKVDGTLTAEILTDATAQRLVGAAIALGRALDLSVAAESIEDAAAIAVLQQLGAHMAQGHVFTEPLPADDVERLFTLRSALVRRAG